MGRDALLDLDDALDRERASEPTAVLDVAGRVVGRLLGCRRCACQASLARALLRTVHRRPVAAGDDGDGDEVEHEDRIKPVGNRHEKHGVSAVLRVADRGERLVDQTDLVCMGRKGEAASGLCEEGRVSYMQSTSTAA